ncbi:MAG: hypothetical protein IKR57_05800 [Bacilli bacterium]|nr:hypothetical protein [Bacilli bacterium]
MRKIIKYIKKKLPLIILILIVGGACFFVGRRIGLNTDTSSSNTLLKM